MKIRLVILSFLIGMVSCDKGFEELNQNPNLSEAVDPDELFAFAQHKFYTDYFNGVLTEIWGINTWMQVQADMNGIVSVNDKYFIDGEAINNTWNLYYAQVLGNVVQAMRLLEDDPDQVNKVAILRIFKAYVFSRLVDLWGDVPYSDAFQAVNSENEPDFTPAYDRQEDIYTDLLAELRNAASLLDTNLDSFTAEDWLFQGNVESWRRFANTLRLRLAMRIVEVEPALANEHIVEVMEANNLISTQDQGAHFPHSSFARSPFFELHNTGQGMRSPAHFMIELLKTDDDPRVAIFAEPSPESLLLGQADYFGVPSFLLSSEIDTDEINSFTTSYIGTYFQDQNLEGTTLSYAELCFLQCEAILRGIAAGDAQEQYELGVGAHMLWLGVGQGEIDAYLLNAGAYVGTLEQVYYEKWKTFLFTDPIELFSEYRRTGIPVLTDHDGNNVDISQVPRRLAYPNSEISLNSENVTAVGEGINDFSTPLWWDID